MPTEIREILRRQLDIGWRLMTFHLRDLTTAECLWRPTQSGPSVQFVKGSWVADWPEREDYKLGAPTVAWLTWHVGYWWSMVLDHSFGRADLRRESVAWPGDADSVRRWLDTLHERWIREVQAIDDDDLRSMDRTHWPFTGRSFADVCAWANLELMKNAAEIGYVRFLYAARTTQSTV